jgi:hypothetical protein
VQYGGVVRRRGVINSKPCKISALIRSEGFAEDYGGDFESVCIGTRSAYAPSCR